MSIVSPLVLIVDDDPDTRDMYEVALPLAGITAVVAADVEDAMQRVAEMHPDVVVTDLSLTGPYDGCELIRRVQGTPVIALTGWGDPEHTARAREAGCTAILLKPCLPETLAATVRAMVGGPREREQGNAA